MLSPLLNWSSKTCWDKKLDSTATAFAPKPFPNSGNIFFASSESTIAAPIFLAIFSAKWDLPDAGKPIAITALRSWLTIPLA